MKLIRIKQLSIMAFVFSILSSCNTSPSAVSTSPKSSPLTTISRIEMFNSQKGWGILNFGSSWIVVQTSNGGTTWNVVTPSGSTTKGGISGDFISQKNAWIVFNTFENLRFSSLATTNNFGKSWQSISFSEPLLSSPYNIFFQTPTKGWALEKNGSRQKLIQVKLDAAESKISISKTISSTSFKVGLSGIKFFSSKSGWISTARSSSPELIKTNNSGSKWFIQKLPSASFKTKVSCATSLPQFSSSTNGVVTSSCTTKGRTFTQFYKTTDAGMTWIRSSLMKSALDQPIFSTYGAYVWAIGIQTGNKVSSNSTIAISTNNGNSWRFHRVPFSFKLVQSINLTTPSAGTVLVKKNGGTTLWKTLNGGRSWSSSSFNLK